MDKRLTIEKRIEAELMSYDGTMGIYADDLHGNIIAIGADEAFETASTIKTYILACLFDQVEKGKASLEDMVEYKEEHTVDGSGVLCALEPGAVLRVKDAATLMIIVSDNVATNMMIDYLGLDPVDRRMLRAIIENYGGGPVGLETLAATIGEESVTLEDVYEPYLMQLGFLTRTPRGRCVTRKAYEHLHIAFLGQEQLEI